MTHCMFDSLDFYPRKIRFDSPVPIYEYICDACQHEFDLIRKVSDPAVRKCPECGRLKVKRKVSLTSFQLKGEGWYKDGYSRPSEKPKKQEKSDKPQNNNTAGSAKNSPPAQKTGEKVA